MAFDERLMSNGFITRPRKIAGQDPIKDQVEQEEDAAIVPAGFSWACMM